jgi:hypothetical protein
MPENARISRRDWFRLKPVPAVTETPPVNAVAASSSQPLHSMGQAQEGLQPVELPENHGGINLAELPPMRECMLSEEQVRQLFADIVSQASEILLMQRLPNTQRASAPTLSTPEQLRAAQVSLLSGSVPRLQIRYHWQEVNWIDTLERRADGIRLVRIKHLPATAASSHARST